MGEPAATARVGRAADVATLNPLMHRETISGVVIDQLYDHLLPADRHGSWSTSSLVTGWKTTPDTDAVDFALRPGVRFHDGSELTAEDAAATFRAVLDAEGGNPRRPLLMLAAQELGFEVTGRHQLRVWMAGRSASWRAALACLPVLPRHHAPDDSPLGSGPFRFEEHVPDKRVTIRAFPDHYAGQPLLDRVDFVAFDSTESAVEQLLGQGIDCVPDAPAEIAHALEGQADLRVRWSDTATTYCLAFNLDDLLLRDRRIRRALAHAVDRQGMVQRAMDGAAVVTETVAPRGADWHTRALVPNEYDVSKAASLLDEAGWRHADTGRWRTNEAGQVLRLAIVTLAGDRARLLTAECIAADLRQLGAEVTVELCGLRELLYERVHSRNYQAAVLTVDAGPDPVFLYTFYHSTMVSPNGDNVCAFRNPRVDELLDQSLSPELDQRLRKERLDAVQRIVAAEVPHVTLYSPRTATLLSDRLVLPTIATVEGDDLRSLARWRLAG